MPTLPPTDPSLLQSQKMGRMTPPDGPDAAREQEPPEAMSRSRATRKRRRLPETVAAIPRLIRHRQVEILSSRRVDRPDGRDRRGLGSTISSLRPQTAACQGLPHWADAASRRATHRQTPTAHPYSGPRSRAWSARSWTAEPHRGSATERPAVAHFSPLRVTAGAGVAWSRLSGIEGHDAVSGFRAI